MIKQFILVSLILLSLGACSKRTTDPSAPPEEKQASELTYKDIYELALASQNGGGAAFEGNEFSKEATDDISIYANGSCSKKKCGIALIMENKNAERPIAAVIRAKFKLPGNKIDEMLREYELLPGQALSIGCSHICHQDNSYMIQREIVSARYTESIKNADVTQPQSNSVSPG
ncbi:hypothetical protein N7E81_13700 [Reichenbachiella carrageenanivorans]|uniref:Lipoprotein n=1 Tax=Reichenbachiella carrageenanivorans TaxID=2979869 RepID=A0ABY6CWW7_9BACT|nr:hypothetical protein [Reichenbachiella carrageenanivorans]UXX78411.1 hypothetical protein N7E81_13700 [Reichenbachiella carrageenanivorans]